MLNLQRCTLALAAFAIGWANHATATSETYLPRFATHERTDIQCDGTPFGRHVTIGGEFEALQLLASPGLSVFDEYQPTPTDQPIPLTRTFRSDLYAGAMTGTTFLKAASIDLNGDGRDEVVTANRKNADGQLRLGLYSRTANGGLTLSSFRDLNQTFNDIHLAVGDFDGSTDGKQELAVLIRTPTFMRVYVLTGSNGQFLDFGQGNNAAAGTWNRNVSGGVLSMTSGDMLLDGRDQIVVVNETGSGGSRTINYHLLEFSTQQPQLPVTPGDSTIGSRSFTSVVGTSFVTDDDTNGTIGSIQRLEAVAGDVVDSAAAELVVHFQITASSFNYIGQRLHHFTTTRNAENAITGIGFASRGAGREFDSSFIVQGQSEDGLASFETVIANIDRASPAEIVLARADVNPRLLVSAYKARVDTSASYLYSANGLTVQFTDQSTGPIATREWNFGDNSGPIFVINPTKQYAAPGTYTVNLKVTDNQGTIRQYSRVVTVSANGNSSGGNAASYMYGVVRTPAYEASYAVSNPSDLARVNVAVGDMDKDGIAEVMTIARNTSDNLLRSIWRLANTVQPSSFGGRHMTENSTAFASITALDIVAADFDGDSMQATLGTDCRQVEEPQLRQVIWLPPYFQRLQSEAQIMASFGESITGGSSTEQRSGTFTSHDVSAYLGVAVGSDLVGVDASVRATAGYNYQVSYGALRGSENSFSLDQSYSQDQGEALVVMEENSFNCFSYDVESQTGGVNSDSRVRMCEVIENSRYMSATDATSWDTQIAGASPGHPPAQWMPLQRDWASQSLFKPVGTNTGFVAGKGPDKATDGLFTTEASSTALSIRPYLQIDLGAVRDISNIRVFPFAGQAAALKGFRVYASMSPMTDAGIPVGAGIATYAPETGDDAAFDRWSIWTRSASAPYTMLRARYLRVQHPGVARLRIAEIQVFGESHAEPPAYPDAVCDPIKDDGLFNALVWDPASGASGSFRSIEVRGNMLWNGSGTMPGCTNYSGMLQAGIWTSTVVGATGATQWNLSSDASGLIGSNTSFESSVRVGAEFDLEAGFIGRVLAGGAYEYTSGITEEVQSTSFWGNGLEIGGAISGFGPAYANLISACRYNPRPYAYQLEDLSNTGYEHTMYVVDYVVRQGQGLWQRGNVPLLCTTSDQIFAGGFD